MSIPPAPSDHEAAGHQSRQPTAILALVRSHIRPSPGHGCAIEVAVSHAHRQVHLREVRRCESEVDPASCCTSQRRLPLRFRLRPSNARIHSPVTRPNARRHHPMTGAIVFGGDSAWFGSGRWRSHRRPIHAQRLALSARRRRGPAAIRGIGVGPLGDVSRPVPDARRSAGHGDCAVRLVTRRSCSGSSNLADESRHSPRARPGPRPRRCRRCRADRSRARACPRARRRHQPAGGVASRRLGRDHVVGWSIRKRASHRCRTSRRTRGAT